MPIRARHCPSANPFICSTMRPTRALSSCLLLSALLAVPAFAHGPKHHDGIAAEPTKAVQAPFDVVHTKISTEGNTAVFHMAVSGRAGATRPARSGKLAGSAVFSYVWPTSLDPSTVG